MRVKIVGVIFLFLFPFIIYFNSLNNDFLAGDDEEIVLRNVYLRDWRYLPRMWTENYKAGAGSISNFWRPFQILVYAVISHSAGITPLPFHLASILFHSLSAIFLYLLFVKLLPQKIPRLLILLGVLFWVSHPIHNEEIAVTTGIASPGYAFGVLAGSLSFIYFEETRKIRWLIMSCLGFIFGLCFKESAVIFPLLVLGMHITGIKTGIFKQTPYFNPLPKGERITGRKKVIARRFSWRTMVHDHIFLWLIAFVYVLLRLTALNFQNTLDFYGQANVFTENFVYRLWTLWTVLVYGLKIMFFPVGLHPEKSWPVWTNFFSLQVVLSFVLLSAIVLAAVKIWNKNKVFSFGIFWFFCAYLPMSNLAAKINALVWDHWFYLPSAGIILSILSMAGNRIIQKVLLVFLIPAVVICSLITMNRNHFWKNTESASRLILAYEPESAKTWNNLAMAEADKGRFQEAAEHYLMAIKISDVYPQAHHNLANVYAAIGEYDLAEKEYRRSLEMDNKFYHSYLGLGNLYFLKGDRQQTTICFREALKIYPHLPQVRKFLDKTGQ